VRFRAANLLNSNHELAKLGHAPIDREFDDLPYIVVLDRLESFKISEVNYRACRPSVDMRGPDSWGVPLHQSSRVREDHSLSLFAVRPGVTKVVQALFIHPEKNTTVQQPMPIFS